MSLHPVVQEVLEAEQKLNPPPLETLDPAQARAGMDEKSRALDRPEVGKIADLEAP